MSNKSYNQPKIPSADLTKCGDYFSSQEIKQTPWPYRKCKKFKRLKKSTQLNFCEQLNRELCLAASKSCCFIEDQATEWYKKQKELRGLMMTQKRTQSEPCLDLKPNIREMAEVAKNESPSVMGIKAATYISPEFQELLRQHDERMRERYLLNNLPKNYTRRRLRKRREEREEVEEEISEHSLKTICSCDKKVEVKKKKEVKPLKKVEGEDKFSCCGLRKKDPIKKETKLETPQEPIEKEADEDKISCFGLCKKKDNKLPKVEEEVIEKIEKKVSPLKIKEEPQIKKTPEKLEKKASPLKIKEEPQIKKTPEKLEKKASPIKTKVEPIKSQPEKSDKDFKAKFSNCFKCFKSRNKVEKMPTNIQEEKEELVQPKVSDYYRPRVLNYYQATDDVELPKVAKKEEKKAPDSKVLEYYTPRVLNYDAKADKKPENLNTKTKEKENPHDPKTKESETLSSKLATKKEEKNPQEYFSPRVLNYGSKTDKKLKETETPLEAVETKKSSKDEKPQKFSNEKRNSNFKPRIRSLKSTKTKFFPEQSKPGAIEIIKPFSQPKNNNNKKRKSRNRISGGTSFEYLPQKCFCSNDRNEESLEELWFKTNATEQITKSDDEEDSNENFSDRDSYTTRSSLDLREYEERNRNFICECSRSSMESVQLRSSLGSRDERSYGKYYDNKSYISSLDSRPKSYTLASRGSLAKSPHNKQLSYQVKPIYPKIQGLVTSYGLRQSQAFGVEKETACSCHKTKAYDYESIKENHDKYRSNIYKPRNYMIQKTEKYTCECGRKFSTGGYITARNFPQYRQPSNSYQRYQDSLRNRGFKNSQYNCECDMKSCTQKFSRIYDYEDPRSPKTRARRNPKRYSKDYSINDKCLAETKACYCFNSQRNNTENKQKYPTSYDSQTYDKDSMISYEEESVPPASPRSYYGFKVDERYFLNNSNSCNCYNTNNERDIFREIPDDSSRIFRKKGDDRYRNKPGFQNREELKEIPTSFRGLRNDEYEKLIKSIENRDKFHQIRYRGGSKDPKDSKHLISVSKDLRNSKSPILYNKPRDAYERSLNRKEIKENPVSLRNSRNNEYERLKNFIQNIDKCYEIRYRAGSKDPRDSRPFGSSSKNPRDLRPSVSWNPRIHRSSTYLENFDDLEDLEETDKIKFAITNWWNKKWKSKGQRKSNKDENVRKSQSENLEIKKENKETKNRSENKSLDQPSRTKSLDKGSEPQTLHNRTGSKSLDDIPHDKSENKEPLYRPRSQSADNRYNSNYYDNGNTSFRECKCQISPKRPSNGYMDPSRANYFNNNACKCRSSIPRYSQEPRSFRECKCQIPQYKYWDRNECNCRSPRNSLQDYKSPRNSWDPKDFVDCKCQISDRYRSRSLNNNVCKCLSLYDNYDYEDQNTYEIKDQRDIYQDFRECNCQINRSRQSDRNTDRYRSKSLDNRECKCPLDYYDNRRPSFGQWGERKSVSQDFGDCKCQFSNFRPSERNIDRYRSKYLDNNECKCPTDYYDDFRDCQISTARPSYRNIDRYRSKSLDKCLSNYYDERGLTSCLREDSRDVPQDFEECKCQISRCRQSDRNINRYRSKSLSSNGCKCRSSYDYYGNKGPSVCKRKDFGVCNCQNSSTRQSNKNLYVCSSESSDNNKCNCSTYSADQRGVFENFEVHSFESSDNNDCKCSDSKERRVSKSQNLSSPEFNKIFELCRAVYYDNNECNYRLSNNSQRFNSSASPCRQSYENSNPCKDKSFENKECKCRSSSQDQRQASQTFKECKCQISSPCQCSNNLDRFGPKSADNNECKCLTSNDQKEFPQVLKSCQCQTSNSSQSNRNSEPSEAKSIDNNNNCKCCLNIQEQRKVQRTSKGCQTFISPQSNKNSNPCKNKSLDNDNCKCCLNTQEQRKVPQTSKGCQTFISSQYNKNSEPCKAKSFYHKDCKCSSSQEHRKVSQALKNCKCKSCQCCPNTKDQKRVSKSSGGCKYQDPTPVQTNKNFNRCKNNSWNKNECKCLSDAKDQRKRSQIACQTFDNNECNCCPNSKDQKIVFPASKGGKCQDFTSCECNKSFDSCSSKSFDNNECSCCSQSKDQKRISLLSKGCKCQDSIATQANKNRKSHNDYKCYSNNKYQRKNTPASEGCKCQVRSPNQCEKNDLHEPICNRQSCKYQAQECPLSPHNKNKISSEFKECLCSSLAQNKRLKDNTNQNLTKYAEYFLGSYWANNSKSGKSNCNGRTKSCMAFEFKKLSDFKKCSSSLPNSTCCSRMETESDTENSEESSCRPGRYKESTDSEESLENFEAQSSNENNCGCNINKENSSTSFKEIVLIRRRRSKGGASSNTEATTSKDLPVAQKESKEIVKSFKELARDSSKDAGTNIKEQTLLDFRDQRSTNSHNSQKVSSSLRTLYNKEFLERSKDVRFKGGATSNTELNEKQDHFINATASQDLFRDDRLSDDILTDPPTTQDPLTDVSTFNDLSSDALRLNDVCSSNIEAKESSTNATMSQDPLIDDTEPQDLLINTTILQDPFGRFKDIQELHTDVSSLQDPLIDTTTSQNALTDDTTSQYRLTDAIISQDSLTDVTTAQEHYSNISRAQDPLERFEGGATANEIQDPHTNATDDTISQAPPTDATTSQDPTIDTTTSQDPPTDNTPSQDPPTDATIKSQTPPIIKKKFKALSLCCKGPQRYSSDSDSEDDIKSHPLKLCFKDSLCCIAHRRKTSEKKVRLTVEKEPEQQLEEEEIVTIQPTIKSSKKFKLPLRPPGAPTFLAPANVSKNHEACYKDSHYWLGIAPNYPYTYQQQAKKQQLERDRSIIRRQKLWGNTRPRPQPSKEFYQAKKQPDIKPSHRKCFSGTSYHTESEDERKKNRDKRKKKSLKKCSCKKGIKTFSHNEQDNEKGQPINLAKIDLKPCNCHKSHKIAKTSQIIQQSHSLTSLKSFTDSHNKKSIESLPERIAKTKESVQSIKNNKTQFKENNININNKTKDLGEEKAEDNRIQISKRRRSSPVVEFFKNLTKTQSNKSNKTSAENKFKKQRK